MDELGRILLDLYRWDLEVLANPWMWYPLGIPGVLFCFFMVFKWIIVTMPLWLTCLLINKVTRCPKPVANAVSETLRESRNDNVPGDVRKDVEFGRIIASPIADVRKRKS